MSDAAVIPGLRTKLNNRAHQRAQHDLRDRHYDEYEHLVQQHRARMGLGEGRGEIVDLELALEAFGERRPRGYCRCHLSLCQVHPPGSKPLGVVVA